MCTVLLLDRETEEAYGHENFSGAVAFGGKNLNAKCFDKIEGTEVAGNIRRSNRR